MMIFILWLVITPTRGQMSQDTIVKQLNVDADRATIYRILNRFCEDGIIHKVVADDGKQYFAVPMKCDGITLPENHFHCTSCETIECLPAKIDFSVPENYTVHQMKCVLIGVCKDCS